eukprot:CAMPEP_0184737668 /NCGR_PEP_ID=MMETSP0315-20130426/435_1 /TAXON_ID=101924 /ORGANISM="Rhodosorus marinus, Strain UTEX LB 2760" /LENGTH=619 /DNA_ID=CAMNT_0027204977 /DNA_START=54 /DNA_END=1913 /DNA_ORIENTATION=-
MVAIRDLLNESEKGEFQNVVSWRNGTAESISDESLTDVESEESELRSGVLNNGADHFDAEIPCDWEFITGQRSDDDSCIGGPIPLVEEWSSTFGKNSKVAAEDSTWLGEELSRCSSLTTNPESELEQSVRLGDEEFISQFEKDLIAHEEAEREVELAQASLKGDLKRLMSVCCPQPDAERKRALDEVALIANRVGAEELSLISIIRGIYVAKNAREVSTPKQEHCEILGSGSSSCSHRSFDDVEELERTKKLCSHALASYGGAFDFLKTKDIYGCLEEELAAGEQKIRGQLGGGSFTLLGRETGICKPRYYVAVDHSINSIVLSVKGTSNFNDFLTDLSSDLHPIVAKLPPSHGEGESKLKSASVVGGVHRGFYQSAAHVLSGARDELLRLSDEHPGYDIFLTGHSLGASVASIATILLYKDEDFVKGANRTRCIAFGPAPSVTENVGEAFNGVITSYINKDDLVSGLEVHAAARFVDLCKGIEKLPLLTRLAIDFGLTRFVSGQLKNVGTSATEHLPMPVYTAGTVVHIRSKECCDRISYSKMQRVQNQSTNCSDPERVLYHHEELRRVADSIERVPTRRQKFQQVKISANAWLDHHPDNYVTTFAVLLAAKMVEVET